MSDEKKIKKVVRRNLPINTTYKITDAYYTGGIMENPQICDNCGKLIANVAVIESAEGKEARVGMDCAKTLSGIGNSLEFMSTENNFKEAVAIRNKVNKNLKDKAGILNIENLPSGQINIEVDSKRGRLVSEYVEKEFFFKHLPDMKDKISNPEKNEYAAKYHDNHDFGINMIEYFKTDFSDPIGREKTFLIDEYKVDVKDEKRKSATTENHYSPDFHIRVYDKDGNLLKETNTYNKQDIAFRTIWQLNAIEFEKFNNTTKMATGGEIKSNILGTFKKIKKEYYNVEDKKGMAPLVEINRGLPYVAVNHPHNNPYFAQGESAEEIIQLIDEGADKFNVTPEEYLVYYLDGAGVFSDKMEQGGAVGNIKIIGYHITKRGENTGDIDFEFNGEKYRLAMAESIVGNYGYGISKEGEEYFHKFNSRDDKGGKYRKMYEKVKLGLDKWLSENKMERGGEILDKKVTGALFKGETWGKFLEKVTEYFLPRFNKPILLKNQSDTLSENVSFSYGEADTDKFIEDYSKYPTATVYIQASGYKTKLPREVSDKLVLKLSNKMETGGGVDWKRLDSFNGLNVGDKVLNAVGKGLFLREIKGDEYWFTNFGGTGGYHPFGKEKVDKYIKQGEWKLVSEDKMETGGGIADLIMSELKKELSDARLRVRNAKSNADLNSANFEVKMLTEKIDKMENGCDISELTGHSKDFVQYMKDGKIQRKTFLKDNPKHEARMEGIQQAIDNHFIRVSENPIDSNEVWIRPTAKLMDQYFEKGGSINSNHGITGNPVLKMIFGV